MPVPEVDDALALEIGRIVVRAVWVDAVCADLAVEFQRKAGAIDRRAVTGQSGKRLATALRAADAAMWADEYQELYDRRNDVVHGRWSARADHLAVVRDTLRGVHAGAFTVQVSDRGLLTRLEQDLASFYNRARTELFKLAGLPEGGLTVEQD